MILLHCRIDGPKVSAAMCATIFNMRSVGSICHEWFGVHIPSAEYHLSNVVRAMMYDVNVASLERCQILRAQFIQAMELMEHGEHVWTPWTAGAFLRYFDKPIVWNECSPLQFCVEAVTELRMVKLQPYRHPFNIPDCCCHLCVRR